jgi:hypothetical protein
MNPLQAAYRGLPFACAFANVRKAITFILVIDHSRLRLLLANQVSNKVADCILPS